MSRLYRDYAMPYGIFGSIPHLLLIRRQLEGIFDYWERILTERFGQGR